MTPEQIETIRWLRSMPGQLEFAPSQIDAEQGILHDVVMVQEGEAKGHGVHLEEEFISDLVAYDQRNFGERGVKARLGHPGASDNTMGTQLGYFRNIRKRTKGGKMQAIGDLHLLESADISPEKPQMREWVLSMSEEAPDWIMSSIVFRPGRYYQRNKKDKSKKYVWEYVKVKDEDGNEALVWQSSDPKEKVFVEFGERGAHYFTDLVEDGAATESLFSTGANPHLFVSQVLEFLDSHPELKQFAQQHPEKVSDMLLRLGINPKPKPSLKMSLKEMLFGKEKPETDNTLSPDDVAELRQKMTDAEAALSKAATDLQALQAEANQLKVALQAKDTELATAKARVTELEAKAAALHTEGRTEGDGTTDDGKPWESLGINQRAAQIAASRKK